MSKTPWQKFVVAVCLSIAALALWNTARFWRGYARFDNGNPYGTGARHDRFAALSAKLGPATKTLDFITAERDTTWREALYYEAAYELTPRFLLLDPRTPASFLVGSFRLPVDPAAFAQANGLQLVEDFGAGVVLFHRPRNTP